MSTDMDRTPATDAGPTPPDQSAARADGAIHMTMNPTDGTIDAALLRRLLLETFRTIDAAHKRIGELERALVRAPEANRVHVPIEARQIRPDHRTAAA